MQYWTAEAIFEVECPQCHTTVEFYKDDTNRKCPSCGHRFVNPKMDFGCAAYCQYAQQCLGTLPEELSGVKDNLLKDKVAVEMKRFLKKDFHRIGHATRVAGHAEAIGKIEGANLAVVLCASYLHDIGSTQSIDEPSQFSKTIAEEILLRLKAQPGMIETVCALIGGQVDTIDSHSLERQVLEDAKILATREDECRKTGNLSAEVLTDTLAELHTRGGHEVAKSILGKYLKSALT
jgi:hypothetical protein